MLYVFKNTGRLPSMKKGGVITEYITSEVCGRPVAADKRDGRMFKTLSRSGTPAPMPEGLDVKVFASNEFLIATLG